MTSLPPVNAGARLDRLPICAFHRRIMWLIGVGMFFDGFDIYVAAYLSQNAAEKGQAAQKGAFELRYRWPMSLSSLQKAF